MSARKLVTLVSLVLSNAALASGFYGMGEVTHAVNSLDRDHFDTALQSAGATNLSSRDNGSTNRWRLQGGYAFNRYFAVEGGYIDFGTADYKATINGGTAKGSLKAAGLDVAALVSLPLTPSFSLFAKAGAVAVKAKAKLTSDSLAPALDTHSSTNDVRPLLGIGAIYAFNRHWDLRADYDQVSHIGKSRSTGTMTSRMFSLGVMYRF